MAKDLSLIFPCYNEAPVFRDSVARARQALSSSGIDFEIIFVDDCSSDGTQGLIRQELKSSKCCSAIFHASNVGRGGSVADGIRAARGRVAGYLDIDLEISPVYIAEMLRAIDSGCEVACAHRHYDFTLRSAFRNLLHSAYSSFAVTLLRLPVSDPNAGCKFFLRKGILPVLGATEDRHWFWDTEVVKRAQIAGLKMREVPVLYLQNAKKRSSVKVLRDTAHFIRKVLSFRELLAKEGAL